MTKVYFLTGANRGMGLCFARQISALPNTTLIAATRNPSTSTELSELASKTDNIKIVKLDVSSEESINELDSQLKDVAPDGIDYLVSNAGIAKESAYQKNLDVSKEAWLDHYTTNAVGPILLTAKLYPYLKMRETKVLYYVSSSVGSIGGFVPTRVSAYGQSKAALNYSIRSIAMDLASEGFTAVAVDPGFMNTTMGNAAVSLQGARVSSDLASRMKADMIEPETSVQGQVALMQRLTKADNGKFFRYDGSDAQW